jgi:hypothetical protein
MRLACVLSVLTVAAFCGVYFGLIPTSARSTFRLVELEQFVATTDLFDDTGFVRYLVDYDTVSVESTTGVVNVNCKFASYNAVPAESMAPIVQTIREQGTERERERERSSMFLS